MTIREKSQFVQSEIRKFLNDQISSDKVPTKEYIIEHCVDIVGINFHEPRSK